MAHQDDGALTDFSLQLSATSDADRTNFAPEQPSSGTTNSGTDGSSVDFVQARVWPQLHRSIIRTAPLAYGPARRRSSHAPSGTVGDRMRTFERDRHARHPVEPEGLSPMPTYDPTSAGSAGPTRPDLLPERNRPSESDPNLRCGKSWVTF